MNRLSLSQITWSLAVLLIATGGALAMGAAIHHIVLPLLAGVVILAISSSAETPAAEPAIMLEEPVDIADDPALAAMMEGIDDPLMLIERGRIVRANRAALRLLGVHVLNEDARIAIRHPAAAERLSSTAPMAEPVSIELVGLGTREQRWQMRIAPVGDVGAIRRMVHLSDRSGAYAAEKMRVDFVANASHELRTPLSSIIGYVETMLEADADDGRPMEPATRHRFLEVVAKEGRRLQALVEDLMSLSRVEAGKHELPPTVLDLRELAEQVVSGMTSLHGKDRIVLDADPRPMPVRGDTQQLDQLMRNLIDNAMKYGSKSEPVRVTAKYGEASYELTVADSGEGIAPEHLPHLTRRFYRTDPGRSRAAGGTGLGLAIVKHIVERHRGRLDIASELGVGTTITVRLPRHVEDESQRVKKTVD